MEKIQILLSKFEDGSATDIEKRELLEELSLNEETLKQLLHTDYERIVQNGISILSREDSKEIFRLIQSKKEAGMVQDGRGLEGHVPVEKDLVSVGPEGQEARGIKKRRFIRLAAGWTAAAAIAGLAIFGWKIWTKTGEGNKEHQDRTAYHPTVQMTDTIANGGHGTLEKTLADGTVVSLETGSVLMFSAPFGAVNREINLIGKAMFNVAKGSAKPFTVLANGLATTALGTKFSVNAFNDDVSVKLFEGKVVVKAVRLGSTATGTYLLPGDQFNMNMQTFKYAKTQFNFGEQNRHGALNAEKSGLALQFNKTPLDEVFDKLSKHYKVEIKYNMQEVHGLPFTGSFLASDSLKMLLTILCSTNDLRLTERGNVFYIAK